jgi:hypothetical protein
MNGWYTSFPNSSIISFWLYQTGYISNVYPIVIPFLFLSHSCPILQFLFSSYSIFSILISFFFHSYCLYRYGQRQNSRTEVEEYEGTVVYRTLLFHNYWFLRKLGKAKNSTYSILLLTVLSFYTWLKHVKSPWLSWKKHPTLLTRQIAISIQVQLTEEVP